MIIKQTKLLANMSKFTAEQIVEVNSKLKTPEEALKWALDNIHPKLGSCLQFWC